MKIMNEELINDEKNLIIEVIDEIIVFPELKD